MAVQSLAQAGRFNIFGLDIFKPYEMIVRLPAVPAVLEPYDDWRGPYRELRITPYFIGTDQISLRIPFPQ